jgi:CheY-like chemotaxis protein
MQKILIIEDETIFREQLMDLLTFEGYVAIGAKDGIAGVALLLQEQPDVIVSDITMPGLDGYGVLKVVRTHPAIASTPLIFISARVAQEDIRKGLVQGANAYLTKPFKHQELLQLIQVCIAQKPDP